MEECVGKEEKKEQLVNVEKRKEKVEQVVPGKKVGQVKHGADQYPTNNSGMCEIVKQYDSQ